MQLNVVQEIRRGREGEVSAVRREPDLAYVLRVHVEEFLARRDSPEGQSAAPGHSQQLAVLGESFRGAWLREGEATNLLARLNVPEANVCSGADELLAPGNEADQTSAILILEPRQHVPLLTRPRIPQPHCGIPG